MKCKNAIKILAIILFLSSDHSHAQKQDSLDSFLDFGITDFQKTSTRQEVVRNAKSIENSALSYRFEKKWSASASIEQATVMTNSSALHDLRSEGWSFRVFDVTPTSDTGGVVHAFVVGTSPNGEWYEIDPWNNTVRQFDQNNYPNAVGFSGRAGVNVANSGAREIETNLQNGRTVDYSRMDNAFYRMDDPRNTSNTNNRRTGT